MLAGISGAQQVDEVQILWRSACEQGIVSGGA
jgi:hypothetical protein